MRLSRDINIASIQTAGSAGMKAQVTKLTPGSCYAGEEWG